MRYESFLSYASPEFNVATSTGKASEWQNIFKQPVKASATLKSKAGTK